MVTGSEGVQPKVRRCHSSEFVNVRTAWGAR